MDDSIESSVLDSPEDLTAAINKALPEIMRQGRITTKAAPAMAETPRSLNG